jgi:phage terminase Nu1 subunit (DNA packaging protein)
LREAKTGTARGKVAAGKRKRRARVEGPLVVTAGRFGDIVGVHHNTVGSWLKEGLPAVRRGRRTDVDLAAGVQWIRARDRRELEAQLEELRQGRNAEASKAAKIAAEARLRELDVAERQGRLIPADEVESRWSQMVVSFREAVMAVAGQAVQAGLIEPAGEGELEGICRDTLTALGRPRPAHPAPAAGATPVVDTVSLV